MKKKIMLMLIICLLFPLFGFTSNEKNSDELSTDEKIEIISMISQEPKEDIVEKISYYSHELGYSFEQMVNITYEEYVLTSTYHSFSSSPYSDVDPGGDETIDKVCNKIKPGDYFYTPSISYTWNHGHCGLFVSATAYVHAPGPGKTVGTKYTKDGTVKYGAKFARLRISNSTAVDEAISFVRLKIGYPYNSSIDNKMCDKNSFNCSQLVYCAYKQSDILLNNGSAMFVSPLDLVNDPKSYVYFTYEK